MLFSEILFSVIRIDAKKNKKFKLKIKKDGSV